VCRPQTGVAYAMRRYTLPHDWLSSRASSPEVLKRRYPKHSALYELIAAMHPGDELRKFNSPREAWRRKCGRLGYALVRNGQPIGMVVLRLN